MNHASYQQRRQWCYGVSRTDSLSEMDFPAAFFGECYFRLALEEV